MPPLTLSFPDTPTAEKALHLAGFSIGNQQHGSPRGIIHGKTLIGKWEDLPLFMFERLHGEMNIDPCGDMTMNMNSWCVTVTLYDHAPACAREALMKEMTNV